MSKESVLKKFESLNVWKKGDQRAPHKPLLTLLALGRWQQGNSELTFETTAPKLTELLREFGPERKSDHPELPFFHLQNDGVWLMTTSGEPQSRKGSRSFTSRELLDHKAMGQFSEDVLAVLEDDPTIAGGNCDLDSGCPLPRIAALRNSFRCRSGCRSSRSLQTPTS